jgi:hypothetical protein
MRKTIAALAVTAGLAGGALVGAPLLSSAAPADPTPPQPAGPSAASARADGQGWAKKALADLVAKGTITQAQSDAVLAALKDARPKHPGVRMLIRREAIVVSAEALGMTPRDLRVELRSGKSVAQVAQAKGVDVKKVEDALVADATAQLAKLVASGKITQAQADKRLATLPERVHTFVNATHPADVTP